MFRNDLRASAIHVALLLLFATTVLLGQDVTEAGPRSTWHFLWLGALVLLTMGRSVFGRHTWNLDRDDHRSEKTSGGRLDLRLQSSSHPSRSAKSDDDFFFMGTPEVPRRAAITGGGETYNSPMKPQAFRPGLVDNAPGRGATSISTMTAGFVSIVGLTGTRNGAFNAALLGAVKPDAGGGNLTSVGKEIGPVPGAIPYPGGGGPAAGPAAGPGGMGPAAQAAAQPEAKKEEAKEAKKEEQKKNAQQQAAPQTARIQNTTINNVTREAPRSPFQGTRISATATEQTQTGIFTTAVNTVAAVARTVGAAASAAGSAVFAALPASVQSVLTTVGDAIATNPAVASVTSAVTTGLGALGSYITAGAAALDRATAGSTAGSPGPSTTTGTGTS